MLGVEVPVEGGGHDERPAREEQIVKGDAEVVEDGLSAGAVQEIVEELRHREQHVLVDEVEYHVGEPNVVLSAVH